MDDAANQAFYRYNDQKHWNDLPSEQPRGDTDSQDTDTSLFLSDTEADEDASIEEPTQEELAEKYLEPGLCAGMGCEVKLLLDDGSWLFACKHRLCMGSQFFRALLTGRGDCDEIGLGGISRDDVLLYLRCTIEEQFDLKPIPSDRQGMNKLVALASKFRNDFLEDRIIKSLMLPENPKSSRFKAKLLLTAYRHRRNCPSLITACIRLCASMKVSEIVSMRTWIGPRLFAAIFSVRIESIGVAPYCPVCTYKNKLTLMDSFDFKTGHWTHARPECKARVPLNPVPTLPRLKKIKVNKSLLQ